jgi:transcriptional regulator with PAS, ATPase and Fis domain
MIIFTIKQAVFEFKKEKYLEALAKHKQNVSKVARIMGTSRGDIYNHIKERKKS